MAGNPFPPEDDFNIWRLNPPSSGGRRNRDMDRDDINTTPVRRTVGFQSSRETHHETWGSRVETASCDLTRRRGPTDHEASETRHKILTTAVGYAHIFAESILCHPFLVLKRQCQVSRRSSRYHLTPFTVITLGSRIQSHQGVSCLWKGVGSTVMVKGIGITIESLLEDFPDSPLSRNSTKDNLDNLLRKLTIKSVALVIMTPFICSSLVETVQSSIASETPGVLDCLKEGGLRAANWSVNRSSRLLPIWLLIGPTLFHGLLHFSISCSTRHALLWFSRTLSSDRRPDPEEDCLSEVVCSLVGNLTAEVISYPLETVLFRLCLQGTRTLIDSVDYSGSAAVTPIISDYEGFTDCYKTIICEETSLGLFKGFGALVLSYVVHYAFIRTTKIIVDQLIPRNNEK